MLDNILQSPFLQLYRMSRYTSHKLTNEVCTTTTQQLYIKNKIIIIKYKRNVPSN